jgi:hypothetical protein
MVASILMVNSHRGPYVRADFEHVLNTVGRDAGAPFSDDEVIEEAAANPVAHASFDFLQALDTVSDRQSTPAGRAGGAFSGTYAETELEPENPADLRPELRLDAAGFAAEQPSEELDAPFTAYETIEEVPDEGTAGAPEAGAATDPGEPAFVLPEASDPASLLAELGLRVGMSRAELKRLRREFALRNHPDRLDASRREIASRRMKTANALIDAALRRARP